MPSVRSNIQTPMSSRGRDSISTAWRSGDMLISFFNSEVSPAKHTSSLLFETICGVYITLGISSMQRCDYREL